MDPAFADTLMRWTADGIAAVSRMGAPAGVVLVLTLAAVAFFGLRYLGRRGGQPPLAPDRPGDGVEVPNGQPNQSGPPYEPPGGA